jgi:hypothetical protein
MATASFACTTRVGKRWRGRCCRNSLGFAGGPNSKIMRHGAPAGFQRWIQPRGVTAREVLGNGLAGVVLSPIGVPEVLGVELGHGVVHRRNHLRRQGCGLHGVGHVWPFGSTLAASGFDGAASGSGAGGGPKGGDSTICGFGCFWSGNGAMGTRTCPGSGASGAACTTPGTSGTTGGRGSAELPDPTNMPAPKATATSSAVTIRLVMEHPSQEQAAEQLAGDLEIADHAARPKLRFGARPTASAAPKPSAIAAPLL